MARQKLKIGDVVFHRSAGEKFVVCEVAGDEIKVRWFANGKFWEQELKAAEVSKQPAKVKVEVEFVKPDGSSE